MLPITNDVFPARPMILASFSSGKARWASWVSLLTLSALVLWMYAGSLASMARQWWDDGNYSHGFFVPLVAGYILWHERERWRKIPVRANNFGFAIMMFAVGLMIVGMLGAEAFTMRVSLLVLFAGLVVFLAGWQLLLSVAFPIGYLIFMIPLPGLIYYQLTFPLQLLASRLGAAGLVGLGIHTVREGNLLFLPNCTLEVVEACSGVRSLLSLLAAAVAYAYFYEPVLWKRLVLTASTIPIVISINGVRLVTTGVLSYYFGPEIDGGVIHFLVGVGSFVLALVALFLLHKLLSKWNRLGNAAGDPA
jgi:exosortase